MSGYEELVERCGKAAHSINWRTCETADIMRLVLAEVFRTLETVTPEMEHAWHNQPVGRLSRKATAQNDWLAMLRTSPLAPPKDNSHD